jgi:hypothetical protein
MSFVGDFTMPVLARPSKNSSWREDHVLTVHDLARDGMSDAQMASILGVDSRTFQSWRRRFPLFAKAIEHGRAKANYSENEVATFADYCYKRLPPDLQMLWDEITLCEDEPNGILRMQALLDRHGLRARQNLFLHAMIASNFNATAACRKVGIRRGTLDNWIQTDPDFPPLMDEIHWLKKNFFESAIIRLVRGGEPSAVIHVNKTINKDRGYGTTADLNLNVNGKLTHVHAVIDVDKLNLPIEIRRQILSAYRLLQEQEKPILYQEKQESA